MQLNKRVWKGKFEQLVQWRGVDDGVSRFPPFEAMEKDRLLRCSLRTPGLSIIFHRFNGRSIDISQARHPARLIFGKVGSTKCWLEEMFAVSDVVELVCYV